MGACLSRRIENILVSFQYESFEYDALTFVILPESKLYLIHAKKNVFKVMLIPSIPNEFDWKFYKSRSYNCSS